MDQRKEKMCFLLLTIGGAPMSRHHNRARPIKHFATYQLTTRNDQRSGLVSTRVVK
ncbi:hypothetical protein CHS0354_033836, partial [Potamilus streckersoni]